VEAKIGQLRKSVINGPTVRIMTSAPTTRVKLAAVLADGGWKPCYDIRLQGDRTARLTMLAQAVGLPDRFVAKVASTPLAEGQPRQLLPLPAGRLPRIAEWHLPVEQEQVATSPLPVFSFTIKNSTSAQLMAGEAAVYSREEYLGTVILPALAPDASVNIKFP